MSRAFLSHSSKDKLSYVEIVARQLGVNGCIVDALSFEAGMKTIEEISRTMQASDLFVVFLSEHALESHWVQHELASSKTLQEIGIVKRIYPIIIDPNITHDDPRIPDWMRDEYNLRYISRPTVATRRIKQRIIEISWLSYPLLKQRKTLFVGRNGLIEQIEERLNTFDSNAPVALFASGMNSIGRRSLLLHALKKIDIILESYDPPTILLDHRQSIEDFIKLLEDLGFTNAAPSTNLIKLSIEEKVQIVCSLLREISKAKESILVIDNGCLINATGQLAHWIEDVLRELFEDNRPILLIASRYRFHRARLHEKPFLFAIEVPELNSNERLGLLKGYCKIQNVELPSTSIEVITNNLQGFPEQIFFTVDSIKENGIDFILDNPHTIVEFNSERVVSILNRYESNDEAMDLLVLLSNFDYVSVKHLNDIVGTSQKYGELLTEFRVNAIYESIGVTREYIRLNDSVRDYLSRGRRPLLGAFQKRMNRIAEDFIKNPNMNVDASEYMHTIQEAIQKNLAVPENLVIPSHFLKSMWELYNTGSRFSLTVELADRVLVNSKYMDSGVEQEIRYMLCTALARRGDGRFLSEINSINQPDRDYLMGFYHRLAGRTEAALNSIEHYLRKRPNAAKGIREMVQVLFDMDDFERAIHYAEILYLKDRLNPYNIQAYMRCLVRIRPANYKGKVLQLIDDLGMIRSEVAREMYFSAKAYYSAFIDGNKEQAIKDINQAIAEREESPYCLLTKMEICERFRDIPELEATLHKFRKSDGAATTYRNTQTLFEAKLVALRGDKKTAKQIVESKLGSRLPQATIDKILGRIDSY